MARHDIGRGERDDAERDRPGRDHRRADSSWDVRDAGTGTYALEVGQTLGMELGEMLRGYDDQTLLADFGPPEALAHRLLESVPTPSPWDDALGPFYDSRQMASVLGGISRQALAERRKRRTVLALETADRVIVYPTFQVGRGGSILAGLADILKIFDPDAVDGWTLAGWLVSEHRELEHRTAVEWLREERDPGLLIELARAANRRFAA